MWFVTVYMHVPYQVEKEEIVLRKKNELTHQIDKEEGRICIHQINS
jgi:hypothetical protein